MRAHLNGQSEESEGVAWELPPGSWGAEMESVSKAFEAMGAKLSEALSSGMLTELSELSSAAGVYSGAGTVTLGDAYDGIAGFLRKRDANPKYDEALNLLQRLIVLIGDDSDKLPNEELWIINGTGSEEQIYEYLEEEWSFQWDSYEEEWR